MEGLGREFGEELGEDEKALAADGGGGIIDECEEDGDEKGPVFGDQLRLLELVLCFCGDVLEIPNDIHIEI